MVRPWEPPEHGHTKGGSSASIKTFGHPNGATEEQEGGQDRDKRRALKPWLWFRHPLLHRGSPASPFSEPTVLVKIHNPASPGAPTPLRLSPSGQHSPGKARGSSKQLGVLLAPAPSTSHVPSMSTLRCSHHHCSPSTAPHRSPSWFTGSAHFVFPFWGEQGAARPDFLHCHVPNRAATCSPARPGALGTKARGNAKGKCTGLMLLPPTTTLELLLGADVSG